MNMIKLKKEFRDNWLAALRSGDYLQIREYLYSEEEDKPGYCCLGVACRVVGLNKDQINQIPQITTLTASLQYNIVNNIENVSFSKFEHKLINLNDGLSQRMYINYYNDGYKFPKALKERIENCFERGDNFYYCSFDEIADFIELNTIPV